MPENTFLNLPTELRLEIYAMALTQDDMIPTSVSQLRYIKCSTDVFKSEPGLLNTSRQVRDECATIYYRSNKFQLLDVDSTVMYHETIGPELASVITWLVPLLSDYELGLDRAIDTAIFAMSKIRQKGGAACRALPKEALRARWFNGNGWPLFTTRMIRIVDIKEMIVIGEGDNWKFQRKAL